jgi:hypothetical protein
MAECIFQSVIENVNAGVEKMLDSMPAPSHLLLLVHLFRDDLVHRGFGESSRYPRSTTKAAAAHSPAFSALGMCPKQRACAHCLRGCLKSRHLVWRGDHHHLLWPMLNRRYDTDLTDASWALVAPLLPAAKAGGRPRTTDLRATLNAIFYPAPKRVSMAPAAA